MDAFKGVLPVTDKSDVVSLNGTWKFMLIRGLDYSRCGDFYQNSYDDSSWNTIHVPANWDAIGLTEPKYGSPDSLTGLHRTTFIVPSSMERTTYVS
jgi:beta-galactosidase/beta-glucuronidase